MLSRLSHRGAASIVKCLAVQYQVPYSSSADTKDPRKDCVPEEKQIPKVRDLVNFPRRTRPEVSPPVRMGFIPESWFQFFYPKTGVTGPYMFGVAVGTYLFSKEIIVAVEHGFGHALSLILLFYVIHTKYGDKIGELHNKILKESEEALDKPQEMQKESIRNSIAELEDSRVPEEVLKEILAAKKENILFQMELQYRERVEEVYKAVVNRMEYQLELQNIERRIQQKNLIDYVSKTVLKSITPDLEQSTLHNCIAELNSLASKQ